jgi:hypothetical protein
MTVLICLAISCEAFIIKSKKDPEYLRARRKGAKANIELRVVDDDGKPVPNAIVKVFMGMNYRKNGYWINGLTNTNGIFTIKGKTTGNEIEYYIKKDGYYKTVKLFTFAEMGKEHDVVDGKWQPYGERETIVLREKRNPINIHLSGLNRYNHTKIFYEWLGYDIEKNDFVEPYGIGKVADFEVMIEWDGKSDKEYTGIKLKIQFVKPHSGYYIADKNVVSDFKGPYHAIPENIKLTTAEYYEKKQGDDSYDRKEHDANKCWVIQSRAVVDENGNLIAANYSILYEIYYSCNNDKTGGFGTYRIFNPTPNDTNLEPEKVPTHSF